MMDSILEPMNKNSENDSNELNELVHDKLYTLEYELAF
jgi:hypothetical protein